MSDSCRIDAVALALAVAGQPARAAATLKEAMPSWPALPLQPCLDLLSLHEPGGVSHWRAEAGRALALAEPAGYDVIWPAHPAYPPLLLTIVDPPLLLWVWGDVALLAAPAVALVGSRRATISGCEVAFQLAADLAAAGVVIISGFARGIDAAAHRGALSNGRSVAVLGCGLDQPYPSDHGPLGRQLAASGAVVSEFPPGTPPLAHHFPLRNRTLSGLCHAVVVVQATQRSGSLITARLAAEQGREVMAVPGDVRSGANTGGHALLRDGARLVERAADVLEELGWVASVGRSSAGRASVGRASVGRARSPSGPSPDLDDDGRFGEPALPGLPPALPGLPPALPLPSILAILAREDGLGLDDLLAQTGRNSPDLLEELLDLELAGLVRRDGAGRFLPVQRKW